MRSAWIGVWIAFVLVSPAAADTYPRQPGVDAIHYVFRLVLSDGRDEIEGETTATFELRAAGVREIVLDLRTSTGAQGMTVADVRSADQPLRFTHVANRLVISLPTASTAGQRLTLDVRYRGVPASGLRIGPNKFG